MNLRGFLTEYGWSSIIYVCYKLKEKISEFNFFLSVQIFYEIVTNRLTFNKTTPSKNARIYFLKTSFNDKCTVVKYVRNQVKCINKRFNEPFMKNGIS